VLLVPEQGGERHVAPRPLLLPAADGVELEVTTVESQLADGRPVVLLLLVDVTARRSAERARDQLAGHVELLNRLSDTLTRTLDTTEALDLLAAALVPDLADWVSIQLTDEGGRLLRVGMRHRDASLADQVEMTRQRRLVVATGDGPVLLSDVDDDALELFFPDEALRRLSAQLGVGSVVAVPLPGRGRVLGSMMLVNQPGSRAFSDADVRLALEVGRRAGVALDNARLYALQHDLATELQRSLLTAPPQPHQAQIVVRYVAAAQAAQVGGDWYDVFLQPDGTTVLVIGDVVGPDTRAAAGMSQLRGILRGIGFTTGACPAEILARVDAAMHGLLIETTATAVVARLEQDTADLDRGRSWLHWSSAGHPPPVLISADRAVTVLESGDADLLLGVDPTTPRAEQRTVVRQGDTLLLYTDGLVERRGQSLDEGLAALVDVLADVAALPLDDLCDSTLRRLLGEEPEDDVALIAVRLHA
jgi:serine phosphatase RsbU (regulator of sigma subunit)